MEHDLNEWGRLLKTGVAGLIFVALLVGGGAAALTGLAAGLNAISGGRAAVAQEVKPTAVTNTPITHQQTQQSKPKHHSSASKTTVATPPATAENSTAGLTSPIGDAIDSGGVVIGNSVQTAFGHVLSHVLDVLFMEQSGSSNGGTTP